MRKGTKAKYYVDSNGNYIGAYCGIQQLMGTYDDGSQIIIVAAEAPIIPLDAIEVPIAPSHGLQKWDHAKSEWKSLDLSQNN